MEKVTKVNKIDIGFLSKNKKKPKYWLTTLYKFWLGKTKLKRNSGN